MSHPTRTCPNCLTKDKILLLVVNKISDEEWNVRYGVCVKCGAAVRFENDKPYQIFSDYVDSLMHDPTEEELLIELARMQSAIIHANFRPNDSPN